MERTKKPKTRSYAEGSVYQTNDGRWVAKYKFKNDKNATRRYCKNESAAKKKLKELKALEAKGVKISNQKIEDLMEHWLVTFRSLKLKPASYDAVESNYLLHIKPFIGDYQPHHITSTMLQKLINERANKLGYTALSKVYSILNKFFTYIHEESIIEKNLMNSVEMPQECYTVQSENKIYYLEIDEIKRIEKVIEERVAKAWQTDKWHKDSIARYGYIVLFMINTGLRKGEMLGLTWDDLLYDKQAVNIDKSLGLIKNRNQQVDEPKNIWHKGPPKSKKGIRHASFNKRARDCMQELKRIHEHLEYVDKKNIARTPNGTPLHKSTWTSLLKQICELAEIDKPISPHELRHTYATVCIAKGVNLLVVSELMGHASIQQTSDYVHLLKDVVKEANELIENLIT